MTTLHLNLKKKWFDMILSGEKTEEYREITEHWASQILFPTGGYIGTFKNDSARSTFNYLTGVYGKRWIAAYNGFQSGSLKFKDLNTITFSNGYSKNRPQFQIEFKGIEIREGNPDWGAKLGVKYFVIKLGNIIKTENL